MKVASGTCSQPTICIYLTPPPRPNQNSQYSPQIFSGASSSSRIGWLRKISLDFKHNPLISFSWSWTFLPGFDPRTVRRSQKSVIKSSNISGVILRVSLNTRAALNEKVPGHDWCAGWNGSARERGLCSVSVVCYFHLTEFMAQHSPVKNVTFKIPSV